MIDYTKDLVVGVIGGMGPEATADFFMKLLQLTPATKDQEHLRVLIDSNGKVPDRNTAIMEGGEDPAPVLREMAQNLQRAGAQLLVIPCNTAHYYHPTIQEAVTIPVLHIQQEVYKTLAREYPSLKKVGLLATTSTLYTNLYQRFAEDAGIILLTPQESSQEQLVLAGIRAVKAGDKVKGKSLLFQAAQELLQQGAEGLIAGCTEIPLVLFPTDFTVPLVDATEILAQATLVAARPHP
ncbi:MAG: amino acid racemase [Symbiobacteriaceae bacterium]|nr:amino acid racemase [Symbiobacteriaceae bacterium]